MHAPFPGLQWFGDGKQLPVVLRDQQFIFNLEAMVDGAWSRARHDGLCPG